jgi:hypothetical protein
MKAKTSTIVLRNFHGKKIMEAPITKRILQPVSSPMIAYQGTSVIENTDAAHNVTAIARPEMYLNTPFISFGNKSVSKRTSTLVPMCLRAIAVKAKGAIAAINAKKGSYTAQ